MSGEVNDCHQTCLYSIERYINRVLVLLHTITHSSHLRRVNPNKLKWGFIHLTNLHNHQVMARSNSHLYFAATVALQTASLFGYAVGYIGGCLVLPSFQHHFHLSDLPPTALAAVQARLVLCWIVGAALGVPVGIPVCQRFGRRACLSLSAVAFVVGATLQVIDYDGTGQLALFETGRFLNGLGVGTGSLVAPM